LLGFELLFAGLAVAVFALEVVFVLETAVVFVFVTVAVQPAEAAAITVATGSIRIRKTIFMFFPLKSSRLT
jgi:hypothetical protein